MADDFARPNGLAFSADERQIYIVDTHQKHIRRFDVEDEVRLTGGEVFATCDAGSFDGIRLDDAGRIWAAAHDDSIASIQTERSWASSTFPRSFSNLTFGGPKRNDLFITATSSVYSLRLKLCGVRYPA